MILPGPRPSVADPSRTIPVTQSLQQSPEILLGTFFGGLGGPQIAGANSLGGRLGSACLWGAVDGATGTVAQDLTGGRDTSLASLAFSSLFGCGVAGGFAGLGNAIRGQGNPGPSAPDPDYSGLTPSQKGDLGEAWSLDRALANGDELLGSEVDVVFNINGQDVVVRVDHLVETADRVVVYIEAKFTSGGSPSFTPNQQLVIPELVAAGDDGLRGIVSNAAGAPGVANGDILQVVVQVDVWAGGPTIRGDP